MLTTFVCRICRKFRGAIVENEDADLPPFGSELVSFSACAADGAVDKMPSWQDLCSVAKSHETLFAWYKANSSIDSDLAPFPPDPSVFSADPGDLALAQKWASDMAAYEATLTFAPVPGGLPERDSPMAHVPPMLNPAGITEEAANHVTDERFREIWAQLNGKSFILGHESAEPGDRSVTWTCASKYHKREERRTNQTSTTQIKIQDAITDRQRENAQRTANVKRRHDMRCFHKYSLCSKVKLLEARCARAHTAWR